MEIEVARDRSGSFEPMLIAKGQKRFEGFDEKIIAMYARGMTVREIQGFLLSRLPNLLLSIVIVIFSPSPPRCELLSFFLRIKMCDQLRVVLFFQERIGQSYFAQDRFVLACVFFGTRKIPAQDGKHSQTKQFLNHWF